MREVPSADKAPPRGRGVATYAKSPGMWQNSRFADLVGVDIPIIQAPMAGANGSALAIAVSEAGGLGSLPCATLTPEQIRAEVDLIRRGTARPCNVNFFCHVPPELDPAREAAWKARLDGYYREFGLDPAAVPSGPGRRPFDEAACAIVEEFRPAVVSFHFGMPERRLVDRVKATGA